MTSTGEGGPESSGPDDETTRRRRVEQVADSMRETAGLLGDAARSHDLAMLRLESVVSPEGAVQRLIDAIGNAATELSSLRGLLAVGGQNALQDQRLLTEANDRLKGAADTVWGGEFAPDRLALRDSAGTGALYGPSATLEALGESAADGYARRVVGLQVGLDPLGQTLALLSMQVKSFGVGAEDTVAQGRATIVEGLDEAAVLAGMSAEGFAAYAEGLPGGEPPSPAGGVPLGPDGQ